MLRINSLQNAASYYTQSLTKGDYYSEQSEIFGNWEGKAAEMLGINGVVDKAQFNNLCAGKHPLTGNKLTSRLLANRREAYDFTFSVPKSVSLLSAIVVNPTIEKAITESMIETMKEVEKNRAIGTFGRMDLGVLRSGITELDD